MKKMVQQSVTEQEQSNTSPSSPKYTGVRKRKWGKYVSEIRLPNSRERIWLGSYDTAEKAARAFDAALFCLRGKSAKFNFPDCPPEITGGRSLSRPQIQKAAAQFANSGLRSEETRISESEFSSLQIEECTSPSVSDGATGQFMMDSDLMMDLDSVSGNVSDFGIFPGFDDFSRDFLAHPPPSPSNFDCHEENFHGACNFGQESFLWNF